MHPFTLSYTKLLSDTPIKGACFSHVVLVVDHSPAPSLKMTLPSDPILAVLSWGALISTGREVFGCCEAVAIFMSCKLFDTALVGAPAISLTSRFVRTSLSLAARVCSNIVVGPWNSRNSYSSKLSRQ